jgi:hypothetical protein
MMPNGQLAAEEQLAMKSVEPVRLIPEPSFEWSFYSVKKFAVADTGR